MRNYFVRYETKRKAFVFSHAMLAECEEAHEVPFLELHPDDYSLIGCSQPVKDAPVVGFVMKHESNYYLAEENAVAALAKTGVKIRFLTYEHSATQLFGCSGLLIPDAALSLAEEYFSDCNNDIPAPSLERMAAMVYVCGALGRGIPILATGSGAQVVAGELGLLLYRDFGFVETPIRHFSSAAEAHRLNVFAGTPLQRMFGEQNLFFVNSNHNTLLAPIRVQQRVLGEKCANTADLRLPLQVYAEANDGVPEAWGNEKTRILCVQWSPEKMIADGDEKMRQIYQWLADAVSK